MNDSTESSDQEGDEEDEVSVCTTQKRTQQFRKG